MVGQKISRRHFLGLAGICATPSVLSWAAGNVRAQERPNIIFLMADDQRWDAMGCSGASRRTSDKPSADPPNFVIVFCDDAGIAPSLLRLQGNMRRMKRVAQIFKKISRI